ncbi:MAG: DUF2799 domain-containing protein [Parvularculaceae bacterium]|nr:DUF2799 domain-containing protein [Parvularculaceae bacterium]
MTPLLATLLAGCAGGMNAAECTAADWAALGEADARRGAAPKLFEQRSKDCADLGYAVDMSAYESGRAKGLAAYCTPEGGFEAGLSGADYQGICPPESEPGFLEEYGLGAKAAALKKAQETAAREHETAVADLDQHHYLLSVAEKRYARPSMSNEDREHERQDIEFRRREIARLENQLPKLLDALDRAKTDLQSFRAALADRGRSF